MITVLESINLSTKYLSEKGIESPRINAELLLADILKCKRLDLYLSFDKPLGEQEKQKYREFIKRRGNFEPYQYITGKDEFYGLILKVNQKVLIPRPETEILVENILNLVDKKNELQILDIACGSGNIGIALAVNLPSANLICTDKIQEVLDVAKENAERNSVSDRIQFVKHDILNEELDDFNEFDVIVSNPPYVSKVDYLTLQKEIRDYEPKSALTDDGDGYTFFRAISVKANKKLKFGGKLFFEIAQGQSERVIQIMEKNNFKEISVINDYQNIDRIVFGVRK